jgi:hypothetical protein
MSKSKESDKWDIQYAPGRLETHTKFCKKHHFGDLYMAGRIILTGSEKSRMRIWARLKRCSIGSRCVVTENTGFLKIRNTYEIFNKSHTS